MRFDLLDQNVSTTMNVFIIIANFLNIAYNIPQMVKTYKLKTTGDISGWFLFLRVIGNCIWVGYAIEIQSTLMLVNNIITVFSSLFVGYFKVVELRSKNEIKTDEIELIKEQS